jgi:hypothetical protein
MKGTINGPLTAFPPDAGPIPSVIDDPVRFDNGSRYQNSNQSDCSATHQRLPRTKQVMFLCQQSSL